MPLIPAELLADPGLNWHERHPHLTSSSKIVDGMAAGSIPMVRLASANLAMKRVRSLAHSNAVIRVPGSLEALLESLRLKRKL